MTPITDPILLKSLQNAPDVPVTLAPGGEIRQIQSAGLPVDDFLYGMRKPIDNGAVLAARGLEAMAPAGSGFEQWAQQNRQTVADTNQRAADAYKQAYTAIGSEPPKTSSGPMLLGEAIPTAAMSYAMPGATSASFLPRLLANAGGGALTNLLTSNPNAPPGELAGQAAQGAGLGAIAAPFTSTAARAASPAMSLPGSDVRKMMDIGVRPTPGQASGGMVNRLEQAATSIPIVGDFIKSARARSVDQFNIGVINDALAPIGETLSATKPGRDAILEMGGKISDAYQRAVPAAGGQLDQQAMQELTQLRQMAQFMPADRARQFDAFVDRYVTHKISPNGSMTGDAFKEAESDLGREAAGYLYNRNSTTDERQLGAALRQTQTVLRDWLARTNPQAAGDIQAANAAYAKMLRVENAAARQGEDPGVFSPAQLQAAVKSYGTQRQVARGTALSQDLSDAGRSVLGATVPDSGTPFRHAAQLGLGALAGHGVGLDIPPQYLLGGAAAAGATAGAYNPVSQGLLAHVTASRPSWAPAVAAGARMSSPALATGLAEEQGAVPRGLLDIFRGQ